MDTRSHEISFGEALQFLYEVIKTYKQLDSSPPTEEWRFSVSGLRNLSSARIIGNLVKDIDLKNAENDLNFEEILRLIKNSVSLKIQEAFALGILDPLLPVLAPNLNEILAKNSMKILPGPADLKLKEDFKSPVVSEMKTETKMDVKEADVTIHVVDDARGDQKSFTCPGTILLKQMPYFRKATEGQNLCDVDITVHCDVKIFQWLLKWSLKEANQSMEATTAIPIMLSASFLEMETLVEECLNFCRNNFNQILETKQSFSPVNDQLMERLVGKFSLMDLENVADKRPSVQSRFYCQLIVDLCKQGADPKRGIFKTAASLYCCSNCGNLVSYPEDSEVPCLQNRVKVNLKGEIRYRHNRDESWSLSSHVISLKTELKSWRRVFWRLWSQVHYLHCCYCDTTFAVANMRMCRYHPDTPVFASTSKNKSGTLPVGIYKCCQKNAYRYAPIPLHDGCRTREHVTVCNKNEENLKILEIFKKYEEFILTQNSLKKSPDCVLTPEDLTSRFGSSFTRRSHLIPLNLGFQNCAVNLVKECRPKTANSQASSTSESVDSVEKFSRVSIYNAISFSEEDEDDVSVDYVDSPCKSAKKKPVKKFQKNGNTKERFNKPPQPLERETDLRWNPVLATRVNQDNQRYAEEEFFHSLSKCKSELQWDVSSQPAGGVFAKILQNLREKSQREARAAKLATTTRSAITAAVAANRFKAKINQKLIK